MRRFRVGWQRLPDAKTPHTDGAANRAGGGVRSVAKTSVHSKIEKVRKPRVHISYKVEVGDALEDRQIPFVVGVFSDLSGDAEKREDFGDRAFVEVDRENFENVLRDRKSVV